MHAVGQTLTLVRCPQATPFVLDGDKMVFRFVDGNFQPQFPGAQAPDGRHQCVTGHNDFPLGLRKGDLRIDDALLGVEDIKRCALAYLAFFN